MLCYNITILPFCAQYCPRTVFQDATFLGPGANNFKHCLESLTELLFSGDYKYELVYTEHYHYGPVQVR